MTSKPNPPWKGSPHRYPDARLSASSEPYQNNEHQAAVAGAHPFPGPATIQPKQRRIGRSKRGVRVSRCLPIPEAKSSTKTKEHSRRDSLMQVSGFLTSPYWGALLPPVVTSPKRDQGQAPTEERHWRETNRVGTISRPVVRPCNGSTRPNGAIDKIAGSKRLSQCPKKRQPKKLGGLVDPAAWVSIQRSLLQQGQLSSTVSRDEVVDEAPSPPDIPSRSSSQRKALNHFIRELDKYANAAGTAQKLPVITLTESTSVVSLHTVRPLLPYLNEFQSAGLAVTSDQQKPKHLAAPSIRQSSRKQQPSNPIEDDHNGFPEPKPRAYETNDGQSMPSEAVPTAVLKSSSPPKQKHEGSRRMLPWLNPSTTKPGFGQLDMVAKPSTQLIKDGKMLSKWKEPYNLPDTQDTGFRPHSPLFQKHEGCYRDITHRGAISDAPVMTWEAHQPSTPLQRDVAIPQLPLPGSTGGIEAPFPRDDMACILNKHPNRTDPGSWLPHLPSRLLPGKGSGVDDDSSAPTIPITWNQGVGSGSSLERAISAAIQDVGVKEAGTGQRQKGVGQEKLTAETISKQPTVEKALGPDACTYDPQDHPAFSHKTPSRARRPAKPVMAELKLPTTKEKRKARKEPALQTTAHILPEPPHAGTAIRLPMGPEKDDPHDKRAENGTGGLGVLDNDHDGGNINDRDVLKGLQIAVQAAADDAFDTLIQNKTGLRIRRFLADLKTVGALDGVTGDQRARPRRAMMNNRLTREKEGKPATGSRT